MGEIRNTHIGEIQQLVFNIDGTKEDPLGGLAALVGDVYKWHHEFWQGSGEMLYCISIYHDKLQHLSEISSILYYTEVM